MSLQIVFKISNHDKLVNKVQIYIIKSKQPIFWIILPTLQC